MHQSRITEVDLFFFIPLPKKLLALVAAFALPLFSVAAPKRPDLSAAYRNGVVVAKPRAAHRASIDGAETAERVRVRAEFRRLGGMRVIALEAEETVAAAVERLRATGRYDFVEPDYFVYPTAVPNDPGFPTQWPLENRRQEGTGVEGADIRAVAAWDIVREAPNVIVAVIDSGVRLDHVDVAPNLWRNAMPTFNDLNGARFIDGARSGDITDDTGHGTRVAGVIGAAGNNGAALAGVAWRVQLMPLKVFNAARTHATVSDIAAAFDYAIAHGAHIVNCSFAAFGGALPEAELAAIKAARDAGILVVCSAGNDGQNIDQTPSYPATLRVENIVAVGNSDQSDAAASDSNYGGLVELFAPGNNVPTLDYQSATGVKTSGGTSISAPHVTGALALLKTRFPTDTPRQLINRLLRGADVRSGLAGKTQTGGRLNVLRALQTTTNRPLNDNFAERLAVHGSTLSLRSHNGGATIDPGEPAHAGLPASATLWWEWTAPHSSTVHLTTDGSEFDTVLAVYTGESQAALAPVAANDDTSSATTSMVSFAAQAGTNYRFAVGAKNGATGFALMNLSLAPVNDDFAAAIALSGRSDRASGTTRNARRESDEPLILDERGGTSVWYRWTAPASGRFEICATAASFDTLLAVYVGSSLGALVRVTASDDVESDVRSTDSRCSFDAIAGTTYAIQVDSKLPERTGNFVLTVVDSLWQTTIGSLVGGTPSVGRDGTIYVCQNGGLGLVHAVSAQGKLKWSTEVGYMGWVSPAIAADGTLFVHGGGKVTALASNGVIRWQRPHGRDDAFSSIRIARDGTLYCHPGDGYLYSLAPNDGSTRWRIQLGVNVSLRSDPSIAADGTIYFVRNGDLHAISPEGTLKWREALGHRAPALDAAGNLFVPLGSEVISLTPDRVILWRYSLPANESGFFSHAVLSGDGRTLHISSGERLLALDATRGTLIWTHRLGGFAANTTPAVDTDGTVYVATDDGRVSAIDSRGILKRTWWTGGKIEASPTIFGSTLFVASYDQQLYAFDIGAFEAGGPWPQEGQNSRHTGRFEREPLAITVPPPTFEGVPGDSIVLPFVAVGQGPFSFVWRKDGTVINGATSATLTLRGATVADSGNYTVTVTSAEGFVTSPPALVTIAPPPAWLANLSVRALAGPGEQTLVVGYTTGGPETRGNQPLLIRAMGPALAQFEISPLLAAPRIQLYSGTTLLSGNGAWGGNAQIANVAAQVGAFPFPSGQSRDAAMLTTRSSGGYTAQISGDTSAAGVVLAEIYDATPASSRSRTSPRLVNLSLRSRIGSGVDTLIAGFAIAGASSKTLLIRAVGPGLATLDITDFLREPLLAVYHAEAAQAIVSARGWDIGPNATEIAAATSRVAAFPLAPGSTDSACLTTLEPGTYTVHVTEGAGETGTVLIEIYEVP